MVRVMIVALVVMVTSGTARGQQAETANPAEAGEWVAFCGLRLPSGGDATGWKRVVGTMLRKLAAGAVGDDAAAMKTIDQAAEEAGEGKYVALWVMPPKEAGGAAVVKTYAQVKAETKRTMVSVAGGEWMGHRSSVDEAHAGTMPGVEIAINLNAARHAFEGAFDNWSGHDGRGARVLEALGLSNARVVGIHVRFVAAKDVKTRDPSLPKMSGSEATAYSGPVLAVVDATWSARSEEPGKVYRAALTTDYWPASQMGSAPESGLLCAAAMRVAWRKQVEGVLDFYGALVEGAGGGAPNSFAVQRRDWASMRKASIDRLAMTLDPWVGLGLSATPKAELVVNGRLKADASAAAGVTGVQEVLKGIEGVGAPIEGGGKWVWDIATVGSGWWVRSAKWVITEAAAPGRVGARGEVGLEGK